MNLTIFCTNGVEPIVYLFLDLKNQETVSLVSHPHAIICLPQFPAEDLSHFCQCAGSTGNTAAHLTKCMASLY